MNWRSFSFKSKLIKIYELEIFRAFSAGRVSTPTLHQSARAAVSEMVMQQMRMMGKRLRMMNQIFSYNIW